jgi:hypothetical protein
MFTLGFRATAELGEALGESAEKRIAKRIKAIETRYSARQNWKMPPELVPDAHVGSNRYRNLTAARDAFEWGAKVAKYAGAFFTFFDIGWNIAAARDAAAKGDKHKGLVIVIRQCSLAFGVFAGPYGLLIALAGELYAEEIATFAEKHVMGRDPPPVSERAFWFLFPQH